MNSEEERNISVEIQDFTFIGAIFYQNRNWKKTWNKGGPRPYKDYLLTKYTLVVFNFFTGLDIYKGLESLLN